MIYYQNTISMSSCRKIKWAASRLTFWAYHWFLTQIPFDEGKIPFCEIYIQNGHWGLKLILPIKLCTKVLRQFFNILHGCHSVGGNPHTKGKMDHLNSLGSIAIMLVCCLIPSPFSDSPSIWSFTMISRCAFSLASLLFPSSLLCNGNYNSEKLVKLYSFFPLFKRCAQKNVLLKWGFNLHNYIIFLK